MAEPQPVFFKDSARRVQCKMKVNKLEFIYLFIVYTCIYQLKCRILQSI